jgi:hypothetical protein
VTTTSGHPARAGARTAADGTAFRRRWTWRRRLVAAVGGWLIAVALRLVHRTLRVRLVDAPGVVARRRAGARVIAAFWHDTIALMPLMVTRIAWPGRVTALLGWHRDAELAAHALQRFGIALARGSSTRGAVGAVRGLLEAHARGDDLGIVPDGPRGPRHEAKDGLVQLARTTGLPVVPFGLAAAPARRLGSWDRLQVPLPFARVAIVVGEPVAVPPEADAAALAAARAAVQRGLEQATAAAAAAVGARP